MAKLIIHNLLFASIFLFAAFTVSSLIHRHTYIDVVSYGANPYGETDSTQAFLAAWEEACDSSDPVTIYVPRGQFLLNGIVFRGKSCKNNDTLMQLDGALVAPADYRFIKKSDKEKWIMFQDVDGLLISGGVIDARGMSLWDCKKNGYDCPSGAKSLVISDSKNINISGLTSYNSQMFHIMIHNCENLHIQRLRISAPKNSPNTDGIHIMSSTGVTILNSKFTTGDDCISIGAGTSNLFIENVACGPGHGISIGSLGSQLTEDGVQNVTVKSVTFTGTQNGVRIKTWAKPSNGFVKNILFQDAVMKNVDNPIIIDQNYCPHQVCDSSQGSGIKISNVTYRSIHGTSRTKVGVKLDCSNKNPCHEIRMEDIKLSYRKGRVEAFCKNVGGTAFNALLGNECLSESRVLN